MWHLRTSAVAFLALLLLVSACGGGADDEKAYLILSKSLQEER